MAQKTINVGSAANSGGGDPLRNAMIKINENFTEVYADIAALADGQVNADIKGSVFADDSTLLVDAINGIIPGYISLATLQTEAAAATDFADFQARIAAL